MSIVGDDKALLGPVEYAWIAKKNGVYPYGITGTIANGADAGMARARGFTSLEETVPAGAISTAVGDNGVIGGFRQGPVETPTASLGLIVFDHTIFAAMTGSTVYTDGEYDISWASQRCLSIPDCCLVLNGRAKSQDSGAVNLPGWYTIIYPAVELFLEGLSHSGETPDATVYTFSVLLNDVDTTPWGQTISTNYGQTYGFKTRPIIADYPITIHTIVGDNTAVAFTVDETPAGETANKVGLWTAGTKISYTTAYTVVAATKTITYEAASKLTAGQVGIAVYQFTPSC